MPMTKPLLPAVDAAGQLREVAFALVLRDRRPIEISELAAVTGLRQEAIRDAVGTLSGAGWLDLDDAGRVTGAAGLSLATGPHGLTIDETPFRTWCAYDSLGIAAALQTDARVETTCAVCQAPIDLRFQGGVPERVGPERLWLADGGADLRGSFCTPTVLLCGDEHAVAWAEAQGGQGRLLDLTEAARRGGTDWAECANAARLLA
jgi:predicted transcriptional regulator